MSSIFSFKQFNVNQLNASFKVGTDALILGALIKNDKAKQALDIGTGTGVISLMVAQTHPDASIDSIELDNVNSQLAKHNFSSSSFSNRLSVIEHDFLTFSFNKKYDLIFSNPPFFLDSLQNENDRITNSRHLSTDKLNRFAQKMVDCLKDDGVIFLIVPVENFSSWFSAFEQQNLFLIQKIDISGKPNHVKRTVTCFSKQKKELIESKLTIRDSAGKYTNEYIALTKDFHSVDLTTLQ